MTEQQLQEIRQRCARVTPGPWEWGASDQDGCLSSLRPVTCESIIAYGQGEDICINDKDADFIANSREDVPALLAEIERLKLCIQIARAEGERDGVFKAAERWEVDPEQPNYRKAVDAESEACAKIAEEFTDPSQGIRGETVRIIVAIIRQRVLARLRAREQHIRDQSWNEAVQKAGGQTRCPNGQRCAREVEHGHPCDRDENGEYQCERQAK